MLVLSRQRDETIMIGDDIEVTVVDIRGDKVRLGINAPKHVPVHRKEVYEAIRRENRAAAQVKPEDIASYLKARDKKDAERRRKPGCGWKATTRREPLPSRRRVRQAVLTR